MAKSDPFYQEIRVEVGSVLDELGADFTIRERGTYDSDTLETAPANTRIVAGVVADQELAHSLASSGGAAVDLAWIGKKMLLLKADADPKSTEDIFVAGRWYSMDKIKAVKPADIIVLYMLDLSK